MDGKKRMKMLVLMVSISVVAIPLNLISSRYFGEIYPFALWKLYTQPYGVLPDYYATQQIYVLKDACYIKIENDKTDNGFTSDDKFYIKLAIKTLLSSDSLTAKKRFKVLCQFMYPTYTSFQLVEEYYHPSLIKQNNIPYATKVLLTIH